MKKIAIVGKVVFAVWMVVTALMFAWGVASWIDIVADNTEPHPTHSEYNLFVMLVESAEESK